MKRGLGDAEVVTHYEEAAPSAEEYGYPNLYQTSRNPARLHSGTGIRK